MRSFGELLVHFTARSGISDSELARAIGVQRQTIFRWKEGHTSRPRYREDVLRMAEKLRLAPAERDELLLAAGFAPETAPAQTGPQAESTAPAETAPAGTAPAGTAPAGTAPAETAPAETAPAGTVPPTGQTVEASSDLAPPDAAHLAPPVAGAAPPRSSPPRLFDNPGILLGVAAAVMLAVALGGYFVLPLIFGARDAVTPTPVPVTLAAPPTTLAATAPAAPVVAAAGEKLLLVAPFVGYTSEELRYNVAGRIEEALRQEIGDLQLADVRVAVLPHTVTAQVQARSVLSDTRGLVVIWGEYDAGRVRANVTTPGEGETNWVNPVDSPAKLSLVINEDVPNAARSLALISLGRVYRDEQDLRTALRIFEKALALQPQDPTTLASLHFYIGLLLPKVRGIEVPVLTEAIDHFSAALLLQPQWENLQYNRGTNYLGRALLSLAEKADLDAAVADLGAVVAKQPRSLDPRLNLGIALYQRNGEGDLPAAIAHFDQVIARAPDDARGYYHRGLARIRGGGLTGWSDDLLAAKARNPQNTAADTGLCWGYALEGNAQAALPFCDAAVAADLTGSSFDGRAIAYSDLGRYADAAADLKQYLLWVQAEYPELYAKYHGPEAEGWIATLEQGENPFSAEVRAALR